jgi:hypothetical protein
MNIVTQPLIRVFVLDAQLADLEKIRKLLKKLLVQYLILVQTV